MTHREDVYIGGKKAVSVTQALSIIRKPFLELWRGKLGNKKCDEIVRESQDLGHAFHEAIEGYFRGDITPDMDEQLAKMFTLVKGWAVDTKFNPVELEVSLQSNLYCYYGNADAIGHFNDGSLVIVDWKTSSQIGKDYALQLSAYAQAYKEMTGSEVTDGLIVRVDKKPDSKKPIEVKRYTNITQYFPKFLAAKELYEFMNGKE